MVKLLRIFSCCLLLCLALTPSVHSQEQSILSGERNLDDEDAQAIVDGMAHKLVRGLVNIGTGFGELPKQIRITSEEEGAAMGSTVGPLKGLGMSLVRTFVGVYDTLFFFLPNPGFYNPIIDPVYVWEKEK